MKEQHEHGEYVHKVLKDTQDYVKHLLNEYEKLRIAAAALEQEKQLLQNQVHSLQESLVRQKSEQTTLQKQITNIESEKRKFLDQFHEVEQHNASLANLYVASYRLHSSLQRNEEF